MTPALAVLTPDQLVDLVREAVRQELHAARPEPAVRPVRDPDQRLTVQEAAELAHRAPETMRRAIKAKRLRASKPSGCREYVIAWSDLQAYLGGHGKRPEVDKSAHMVKALALARGGRHR